MISERKKEIKNNNLNYRYLTNLQNKKYRRNKHAY